MVKCMHCGKRILTGKYTGRFGTLWHRRCRLEHLEKLVERYRERLDRHLDQAYRETA